MNQNITNPKIGVSKVPAYFAFIDLKTKVYLLIHVFFGLLISCLEFAIFILFVFMVQITTLGELQTRQSLFANLAEIFPWLLENQLTQKINSGVVLLLSLLIFIKVIIENCLNYYLTGRLANLTQNVSRQLLSVVMQSKSNLDSSSLDKSYTLTYSIHAVFSDRIKSIIDIMSQGIVLVIYIVLQFLLISTQTSVFVLLSLILIFPLLYFYYRKNIKYIKLANRSYIESTTAIQEMIHNKDEIIVNNRVKAFESRAGVFLHSLFKSWNLQNFYSNTSKLMLDIITSLGLIMIFILIHEDLISMKVLGVLFIGLFSAVRILSQFLKVYDALKVFYASTVHLDRILVISSDSNLDKFSRKSSKVVSLRGHTSQVTNFNNSDKVPSIELTNLSFKYHEDSDFVIKNLSTSIKEFTIFGLSGASGSGKSTLLRIICGLLVPTIGEVTIGGQSIHNVKNSRENNVYFVPQNSGILSGSIFENISFGKSMSNANLDYAIHLAEELNLSHLISLSGGSFELSLGEKGKRVSGGEAQRITLVRALCSSPRLLILDEPTSFQDTYNEKKILDVLSRTSQNCTVIISSHKSSTLDICTSKLNLNSNFL
jgi:ABC-type bacteriocin/lantibiotic exporter with double-glycine peptidase domain